MKYIKLFEAYDKEKHADKIELIEEVYPQVIGLFKNLKDEASYASHFLWESFTAGAWMSQEARKTGQDHLRQAIHDAANDIKALDYIIGPKPFGSLKLNFNKRSLLDRLLGRNKALGYTPQDDSIIGQIIGLVRDQELSKHLNDTQLNALAEELWDSHPNNPKNRERQEKYAANDNAWIGDWMEAMDDMDSKVRKGMDDFDYTKFNVVKPGGEHETLDYSYAIQMAEKRIAFFKKEVEDTVKQARELLNGKIDEEAMKHFDDIVHFELMACFRKAEKHLAEHNVGN